MGNSYNELKKVRLRSFRAIEDKSGCEKYMDGHSKILSSIGIHKVTSLEPTWVNSPNVFVFLVEDVIDGRVLGGGRIHKVNSFAFLPIVEAIKEMDSKVIPLVDDYDVKGGTGELCGLWNSREVAGMGFGSVFLSRAGISMTNQIGITSLFSLCAPYTVDMGKKLGFEVEHSLGNNGTFYYPKIDLLATVLILKNSEILNHAEETEKRAVFNLRNKPNQLKIENYRNRKLVIDYKLKINKWKNIMIRSI